MAAGATIVPTTKSMSGAFGDWAYGALGGLVYGLARGIFGNGLIASLAAPVLAGSVIKGDRGTIVATVAGFMALSGMAAGGQAAAAPANGNAPRGTM